MGLQCNIDQRGRTVRMIMGAILGLTGIGLIIAAAMRGPAWLLAAGIVLALGGTFAMFEGAAGWCALRALGVKTKI